MDPSDRDPTVPPGMTPERAQSVLEFVDKLYENMHDLELDDGTHEELQAEIHKVKEHLNSEAPHHPIVEDALVAVNRLLASSTTQKATEFLQEVGRFLTGVG